MLNAFAEGDVECANRWVIETRVLLRIRRPSDLRMDAPHALQ
jgi:hypothetical protein